jgi:heme-degrading monooxygenase HmoA
MKKKAVIVITYDGPDTQDFSDWMDGPHYTEVKNTPGIISAKRFRVVSGPEGHRRYLAILESEDIDATLAWRDSPDGQRSQEEANSRGVTNRYSVICELLHAV